MRTTLLSALVAGLSLLPLASASADVRITISDGFVSVDARDATVRQILDEWARVGQTRVVNAERIAGAPVSLRLVRVPEAQALDILLRSVSGYLAAPRAVPIENASQFDRILVMPTSTPPRAATTAAVQAAPAFQPQQLPNQMDEIDMDDVDLQAPGVPGQRGPVFPQFPAPVNGLPPGVPGNFPQRGPAFPQTGSPFPMPNAGRQPPATPNQPFPIDGTAPGGAAAPGGFVMPPGVSTPGMVAPAPQPGQVPPEPQ